MADVLLDSKDISFINQADHPFYNAGNQLWSASLPDREYKQVSMELDWEYYSDGGNGMKQSGWLMKSPLARYINKLLTLPFQMIQYVTSAII